LFGIKIKYKFADMMNKTIQYLLPFVVLFVLFLVGSIDVIAAGPPCDPSPGCSVNCCEPVPLDGGLSALLLAGIAYGAKRVFGKSKT
jgi:hypothetical protein